MKLNAQFKQRVYNEHEMSEITLLIENRYQQSWLAELSPDIEYDVIIKKAKSKRSIAQNNLLWVLLAELEKVTRQDMMEWYSHALEETNAKSSVLLTVDNAEKELMPSYRLVRKIGKRTIINHKGEEQELWMYRCFIGSSKFNVKEMNELIDTVLKYCAEHNIQTELLDYEV